MGKLTRRHWNVLKHLAGTTGWIPAISLPDGNGHAAGICGASGITLRELRRDGLIEYGQNSMRFYCYRITDAGRRALSEQSNG